MSVLPYVVGVVMCVVGVGLGFGGFKSRDKARKAAAWPVVKGAVSSSELVKHSSTSMGYKGHANKQVSWEAVVSYGYEVGGKKYKGDAVGLAVYRGGKAQAEARVRKYAAGSEVDVHYDPADPGTAVLEPRLSGSGMQFGIGALVLVAGALVLSNASLLAELFAF